MSRRRATKKSKKPAPGTQVPPVDGEKKPPTPEPESTTTAPPDRVAQALQPLTSMKNLNDFFDARVTMYKKNRLALGVHLQAVADVKAGDELRRVGLGAREARAVLKVPSPGVSDATREPLDGDAVTVKDSEPWPHPVALADVLDEAQVVLATCVEMENPHAAPATIGYAAYTYVQDAFDKTPFFDIGSPEHECGKTNLDEFLIGTCYRALPASAFTRSSLEGAIHEHRPVTVIHDEIDSSEHFKEFKNLFNAMHTRALAVRVKNVQQSDNRYTRRQFNVYAPLVVSGIDFSKPPTHLSRSIHFFLQRGDTAKDYPSPDAKKLSDIRQKFTRWQRDLGEQGMKNIRAMKPKFPPGLGHRERDKWRPLLIVADLAGGAWPARMRAAAVALQRRVVSSRNALLSHLRDIFNGDGKTEPAERLHSADLVLNLIENYGYPKTYTMTQLAADLESYEIHPRKLRIGKKNLQGYERVAFLKAWERYLAPEEDVQDVPVPVVPVTPRGESQPVPPVPPSGDENLGGTNPPPLAPEQPEQRPPNGSLNGYHPVDLPLGDWWSRPITAEDLTRMTATLVETEKKRQRQ